MDIILQSKVVCADGNEKLSWPK